MGLGIIYAGLRLEAGDDVLTTEHDFYATHESLRLAADRTGARIRRIRLFERPAEATADEIATRLADAVRPETRLLAITWVHSDTGLALPMAAVAEVVAETNADRNEEDRILVGLDAIHALGVKDAGPVDLGCDLARRLKEGLAELPHVELHTPLDDALSGGIVSFDVEGRSPDAVVDHLRERGIVASTSPYAASSARLSPAIYNNEEDVDTALREVEAMA